MNKIKNLKNKNILFLQGPMGGFFKKVDKSFRAKGANTFKIGFNAGDWFFAYKDNYTPYKGTKEMWSEFIEDFLTTHDIDMVLLMGDCRYYQSIALQTAKRLKLEAFVFEEGYVRPDYITMERHGVNDFSHIPSNAEFYHSLKLSELATISGKPANAKYYRQGGSATTYYMFSGLFCFLYPHYEHHRKLSFINEFYFGIRNAYKKYLYKLTEKGLMEKILKEHKDNYYLVPLQTFNDFQLIKHSDFVSIESFISFVLESFAKHAPSQSQLVIKHHPVDRGRKDYSKYIKKLSKELHISKRIIIAHDIHLPTCLKNTRGTVTINSTVGISSLYHGTPTLTLGRAIYDIEGLTCKGISLDRFWVEYQSPDAELFHKFRQFLITNTQLNGSFYGMFPEELS
jgi:capsular polysaccharide export protein